MNNQTRAMDRISGKKMLEVLKQLTRDRTILRLNALGKGYEGLTIATGVVEEEQTPYLLVDYPAGFQEMRRNGEAGRIRIEFLGPDKIPYHLRTRLHKVTDRDLWLHWPPFIERLQRRRHFRVTPPAGSRVLFSKEGGSCEASMIDLNLGGALVSCRIAAGEGARLVLNERLVDVFVHCASRESEVRVRVKQAIVRRVEEEVVQGRSRCALQFIEVAPEEQRRLEAWIIEHQREMLRRRSLLEGN